MAWSKLLLRILQENNGMGKVGNIRTEKRKEMKRKSRSRGRRKRGSKAMENRGTKRIGSVIKWERKIKKRNM